MTGYPIVAATLTASRHVGGGTVFRLHQAELLEHGLELFAVFGPVDAVGMGAHNVDPGVQQGGCQVERCLTAELNDNACGAFRRDNVKHIFTG